MASVNNTSTKTIIALVVIIVIAVVLGIVLSNNNSSNNTAANKQQITTNWQQFFNYSTSLSQRESLLQNGSQFASVIQTEFSALGSAKPSAVVNSIDITNSSTAKVVYTVKLDGQPVLNGQTGQALLINNTWKVSDSTLCGLLAEDGLKPAVCKGY